jgi:hypothetical protein
MSPANPVLVHEQEFGVGGVLLFVEELERGDAMKLILLVSLVAASPASAQNCFATSTGRVPINDLGAGLYLGQYQGGLYPGGANDMPAAHAAEGLARAASIVPLDAQGKPNPGGRYVLMSVGMSNTTQEFCSQPASEPCDPWTFMGRVLRRDELNRSHLVIVNGAVGGAAVNSWRQSSSPNYVRVRDQVLAPLGLTEAQVQVIWLKNTTAGPTTSLPSASAEAYVVLAALGDTLRTLNERYPNLKMVFLSSRIYAGYATGALNPEPYAYENGFAVKWLIESQINQAGGMQPNPLAGDLNYNTVAPWIAWGPYLWADGLTPRSDGLTWACSDFSSDGVHPAPGFGKARDKVGQRLAQFFLTSPFTTPWVLAPGGSACYANCDGSTQPPVLNVADFSCFLQKFAGGLTAGNCDGSSSAPLLNVADFSCFLQKFAAGCN